jgi:L-lysine 6-transaminase
MNPATIPPDRVREVLSRHMLVDHFRLVVDLDASRGPWLRDSVTGEDFLDFYTFFASNPLGFNHPRLRTPEFLDRLVRSAVHKPANSDVMTVEFARFVDTFEKTAMPAELPHLFLVEGGALAVENALKAAFDWKARKNLAAGRGEQGGRILHFRGAFHGRSGYTMSLTNTDPVKTAYFPKFDWPRVRSPKLRFPLTPESLAETVADERLAIPEIEAAFDLDPHGIAAIVIEPIQCEGGDNHFRPEFLRELRRIADEREALLVFDEVQTGLGGTGRWWAAQHFGVMPDIIAFAKKVQVGGILCSRRIDEVPDNVFAKSSRINSTWGGGLADMVRATAILEVIRDEDLLANAAERGRQILAGLEALCVEFEGFASGARGVGVLLAFDLPSKDVRDAVRTACLVRRCLVLPCGERSIRLRPALNLTAADAGEGLRRIRLALRDVAGSPSVGA